MYFTRLGHGSLLSGGFNAHSQPCAGASLWQGPYWRSTAEVQSVTKKKILNALIVSTWELIQVSPDLKRFKKKKKKAEFCLNRRSSVWGADQVEVHEQAKQAVENDALEKAVRRIQVLEIPWACASLGCQRTGSASGVTISRIQTAHT